MDSVSQKDCEATILWPETADYGVDSLFVSRVVTVDSSALIVPKSYIKEDRYIEKSEERQMLQPSDSSSCAEIILDRRVKGYSVSITLYPDSLWTSVGVAKYLFSSSKNTFEITTGYYWAGLENDVKWNNDEPFKRTYHLKKINDTVQGDAEEIIPTLFCFKDVDFDGEDEICFREPGYNREYYVVYKLINGRPVSLNSRPFNNIVYSEYGYGSTRFDHSAKQITVNEQFGVRERVTDTYCINENHDNPRSPMRHLHGIHYESFYEYFTESIWEDGILIKEVRNYSVNSPYESVEVSYRNSGGGRFDLDTIKVQARLNDIKEEAVIYPNIH